MEDFSLNLMYGFLHDGFLQLAFPYDEYRPTFGLQLAPDILVALLVASNLDGPEIGVRLGNSKAFAAFMPMPKATMDENCGSVLWKDNIGASWKPLIVDMITKAQAP